MSELMEFKQHKKQQNFTIIDNEIFRNYIVSLRACGLYAKVMSLPPSWKFSIRGLASICGDSEKIVKRTLDELKQLGYLTVEKINGIGGKFRYIYHFYETISENPEYKKVLEKNQDYMRVSPDTQNHTMVNHSMDDHSMVQGSYINNLSLNTYKLNNDKNIINNNIIYDRENSDEFSTQDKIPDQNHTKVSTNNMPDINTSVGANAQNATCLVNEYITPQTPDPLPPAGATNVVTKNKRGRKNVIEGDVEIKGQRMADNDNEQSRANKEKQIEKAEKKKVSTEEKKKLNARKMAEDQIKEYTENEELRQTFLDFVDSIHEGKIGQIVSKTRVSQWLKILDDCSSDSERIRMLEVSIGSGYGTLYIQDNIRSVKRNRGRKTAKSVAETTFQEVQKDEDTDDSEDWRNMII